MENVISKYFCIGHFLIDFLSTFFENMINYETVISLQGISAKKTRILKIWSHSDRSKIALVFGF